MLIHVLIWQAQLVKSKLLCQFHIRVTQSMHHAPFVPITEAGQVLVVARCGTGLQ
jgi:hypothetical protein